MGLRRHLTGEPVTDSGVEENLPAAALQIALTVRWLRVLERSHRRIREELFRQLFVEVELFIPPL
jgi:hypothetical protein